jgi:hypothetical protein
MSYTYLQEQEGGSWEECSSDTPQFVLWKLNPIADESYSSGNETESSQSFQSGMMSAHSTETLGEEKLMLCAEDSPAKTSVVREKGQDSAGSVQVYGESFPESLAKYDPISRSWRTHQCLLFEDLTECLETLPKWGMTIGGELFPLLIPEHLICEREFGFSPDGIKTFHTPNTTGLDGGSNSRKALKKKSNAWPTPNCGDAKNNGGKCHQVSLQTEVGGNLNPPWVEWLMGWPIGWADLKPLGMDKFQEWRQHHSDFFQNQ